MKSGLASTGAGTNQCVILARDRSHRCAGLLAKRRMGDLGHVYNFGLRR
jgi:hypothetical protein